MESELKGRLRNTHLPLNKALLPLFEAVVNSIQAAEEASVQYGTHLTDYKIVVNIVRDEKQEILPRTGPRPERDIIGFKIVDDGIGFTDNNLASFRKLDSLWKAEKGCRGVGRLMWLKAFGGVQINSTYDQNGEFLRRSFTFSENREVTPADPTRVDADAASTSVYLSGFKKNYAAAAHKTLDSIASGILEHCLWYFVRDEGVPQISVRDADNSVDLDDLFDDHMHASATTENFELKGQTFSVVHVKFRASKSRPHTVAYCAAGRLVKEEGLIGKIPGLFSSIHDEQGDFTYSGYVTSSYLDEHVTSDRLDLTIPESEEGLFSEIVISLRDIRSAVLPMIKERLGDVLSENLEAGRERLERFVSNVAPKYRPLIGHMSEENLAIDPEITDRDLDLLLHKEVFVVEQQLLTDGHEIMSPKHGETEDDYSARLNHYLQRAADLKQADLANYVMHRRVVIDLLESAIQRGVDGKFAKEEFIHQLIVPMRITSDDVEFRRQSLWLIDERLAFHHFLASDRPLSTNPTTASADGKEPDVSSIKVFNNPLAVGDGVQTQASITVVEIKRPMRNDFRPGEEEEKDPILQSLGYLRRLRKGAQTKSGRPIPNADKIPGFVYVIADFTSHLIDCCGLHQLQKTADGLGYFGYHKDEAYNAYIQVLSFDGLVVGAKERNRAFFDMLGLPSP